MNWFAQKEKMYNIFSIICHKVSMETFEYNDNILNVDTYTDMWSVDPAHSVDLRTDDFVKWPALKLQSAWLLYVDSAQKTNFWMHVEMYLFSSTHSWRNFLKYPPPPQPKIQELRT